MPSAAFTINSSSVTYLAVEPGSTVNLALSSTQGVNSVQWTVEGSHDPAATNPTITPGGSPLGATASFTMPSGLGQSYRIQCQINGGEDANGQAQELYTRSAVVGVANSNGLLPFASGETYERSVTHGSTKDINTAIGNGMVNAARSIVTTTDATAEVIATIETQSDYQYLVYAVASSREDSSSNSAWQSIRFLYTNKGGTLAQQGDTYFDDLNYDDIAQGNLSVATSGTNILVRLTGKAATTIRHEYIVEYFAQRIATS